MPASSDFCSLEFPPLLNLLLDWKGENPISVDERRPPAGVSEWLDINRFSVVKVKSVLSSNKSLRLTTGQAQHVDTCTGLEAEQAWLLCYQVFANFGCGLEYYAKEVFENSPKCLLCRPNKYPGSFCYQFDQLAAPFVSVQYKPVASDLLMLVHEFGHAVQILASVQKEVVGGLMAPVARESCAFLSELLLIDYLSKSENQAQHVFAELWRQRCYFYLTHDLDLLLNAASGNGSCYQYAWNYPLACLFALHYWSCKSNKDIAELFASAGASCFLLDLDNL